MNHIPLWLSESAQSMWLWTGEGRNVAEITLGSDGRLKSSLLPLSYCINSISYFSNRLVAFENKKEEKIVNK